MVAITTRKNYGLAALFSSWHIPPWNDILVKTETVGFYFMLTLRIRGQNQHTHHQQAVTYMSSFNPSTTL